MLSFPERLRLIEEKLKRADQSKNNYRERLQIYAELELLKLDYLENEQHRKGSPNLMASFDEVSERFFSSNILGETKDQQKRRTKPTVIMAIRFILVVLYLALMVPIMLVASSLRLLHPVLRKLGIQNHHLPIDKISAWVSRGLLFWSGIHVEWRNTQNIDDKSALVCLFNHQSNLDPFIVSSGPLAFKFVAKKELILVPFIGFLMFLYGHVFIDRSNRQKAIASISAAGEKGRKWNRSIAISPEGTRSPSGFLIPFKKGAFHMALSSRSFVIQPMILSPEAWLLYPTKQLFVGNSDLVKKNVVTVDVLPTIKIEADDTVESLQCKVRRAMLQQILANNSPNSKQQQLPTQTWMNPWFEGLLPFGLWAVLLVVCKLYFGWGLLF